MADYTPWIIIGGVAVAGWYLYSTGALNGLLNGQPAMAQMPMMPLPPMGSPTPDPNAYYDNYSSIPGIQSLIPTAGIVAQAPPEYLLPVPTCGFDSNLYYNPSIWAANKIWEAQYNQLAQTIAVRNQLALMRCGMVNWYNTIPYDVDFNNPFLQHISTSKRIIVNDFHKGERDSSRTNSAALDAASVVHPITTGHGHQIRTSSQGQPNPGETTPPIQAHANGSTKPVTAFQATAAPYGGQGVPTVSTTPAPTYTTTSTVSTGISPYNLVTGGTAPTGGNYDQSRTIPCITGDC